MAEGLTSPCHAPSIPRALNMTCFAAAGYSSYPDLVLAFSAWSRDRGLAFSPPAFNLGFSPMQVCVCVCVCVRACARVRAHACMCSCTPQSTIPVLKHWRTRCASFGRRTLAYHVLGPGYNLWKCKTKHNRALSKPVVNNVHNTLLKWGPDAYNCICCRARELAFYLEG
jgi:hypothetical protein